MDQSIQRFNFKGHGGADLAARLDLPMGEVRAYAIFAHCFTCTKDMLAARRIAADLARQGIAVLRFDFTGLGSSEGEFASTNFSSNIADLVAAAQVLRENYEAPQILIGHSLGGAAVLAAAHDIPEVRAVVTIAAPSDAAHVEKAFHAHIATIEQRDHARVTLAGRPFTIARQFLDDIRGQRLIEKVRHLHKPLLIMHSPLDEIVGIENASEIFLAAHHPKSFISLDHADHLLTREEDASFAANVIAGWVSRYIHADEAHGEGDVEHTGVTETGEGKFQNAVHSGRHRLFTDEPVSVGGLDSGPSPYDYLSIALAACTSMTLRLYAEYKKMDLGRISVDVSHAKTHFKDCVSCTEEEREKPGQIDTFSRSIFIEGDVPDAIRDKIVEIADKCPVHRTLKQGAKVTTTLASDPHAH